MLRHKCNLNIQMNYLSPNEERGFTTYAHIVSVSECRNRYDVSFVLDISGSVYDVYALGVAVIRQIIYGLEFRFDRTRAGLILYSDDADVRFHLNTYQDKRDLLEALSIRTNGGRTNTQSALRLALDNVFQSSNGDRCDVPNALFLVTDGGSNIQENMTVRRAQDLKNEGTQIYVIAVGDNVNMNEVNQMASESSNGFVYRVFNSQDVITQSANLLDNLCQ